MESDTMSNNSWIYFSPEMPSITLTNECIAFLNQHKLIYNDADTAFKRSNAFSMYHNYPTYVKRAFNKHDMFIGYVVVKRMPEKPDCFTIAGV